MGDLTHMNKKICSLILFSSLFITGCTTTPSGEATSTDTSVAGSVEASTEISSEEASVVSSAVDSVSEATSEVAEYEEKWTDSDKAEMYKILGEGVTIPYMEISDYIIMNNFLDDDTPMTEFYSTTADIDDLNDYVTVVETYYKDYSLVESDEDETDPYYVYEKDMGNGVVLSLNIGLYEFVKDELHFDVFAYLDSSSETVSEDIEITSADFNKSYSDEVMNISGLDLHVTNIMQNVQDNTIQFSSSKKRDAGKIVTDTACSAISSITIEQSKDGFDGELSVKSSADGVTYTELVDQERETDNLFQFNLDGATYFEISNTSSAYALDLNSISIDLLNF